jgi:hypothetical protein
VCWDEVVAGVLEETFAAAGRGLHGGLPLVALGGAILAGLIGAS